MNSEPEAVLGWSSVDYARSTAIIPNTEMRVRIPGPNAAPKRQRNATPGHHIEAAVLGREIECGVLAGADGRPEASLPAEIRLR